MLRCVALILSLALVGFALQLTEKKINDAITLTLVHGGEDAMMSHTDALAFCRTLEEQKTKQATASPAPSTPIIIQSVAGTSAPLSTEATTLAPAVSGEPGQTVFNDLLSLHDPGMVAELMQWILNLERRQFWIGGMVKKVVRPFEHHKDHIIHLWTDRTPTNFRFLHFPNEDLRALKEGEVKCLSVDYASGKWGVHDCDDKMYFVCETIILTPQSTSLTGTGSLASTTTQVSGRTTPTTGASTMQGGSTTGSSTTPTPMSTSA
ncbi:unnamed protein product [Schistocephalus solidus]|uniref:Lectin C-type domain n=1 Tax=Schistocephalus solidus TaxID=70667 RepID=A0A0V0J2P0_SCHSO|nr:unnamed protein product [Schistocephalus solidus]